MSESPIDRLALPDQYRRCANCGERFRPDRAPHGVTRCAACRDALEDPELEMPELAALSREKALRAFHSPQPFQTYELWAVTDGGETFFDSLNTRALDEAHRRLRTAQRENPHLHLKLKIYERGVGFRDA